MGRWSSKQSWWTSEGRCGRTASARAPPTAVRKQRGCEPWPPDSTHPVGPRRAGNGRPTLLRRGTPAAIPSRIHLSIVRRLDIPVNRVLEWSLGPGSESSHRARPFRGLVRSLRPVSRAAWAVASPHGGDALPRATQPDTTSPTDRRGLGVPAVAIRSCGRHPAPADGRLAPGHASEEMNERRSGSHRR